MAEVFISHRSADATEAERLKTDLEMCGHSVRLDVAEVHVGDSIVEWMDSVLGSAQAVIVCYSADGVDAPWMKREWLSTVAARLNGENVHLLPARLTGGDPPPILRDIKYADCVKDWDRAVEDLDRAIRART